MRKLFAGRWLTSLVAAACVIVGSAAVQVASAGPAAAIPGRQIIRVSGPYQSNSTYSLFADCPDDLQVIGGGATIGGDSSDKVFLTASVPLDGGKAWYARAAEVA